jgi:hypothetical protein
MFTVEVFTDANLETVLTAEQPGLSPVDTIVTGAEAAKVELAAGGISMVNGDGSTARNLTFGSKVAQGEVVVSNTGSATQLGHLQLNDGNSAVVLHYTPSVTNGSDGRLIFARGGGVLVYGQVRASDIKIEGAASVKYNKQNLTSYNTSSDPGVVPLGATVSGTQTLSGYVYAQNDVVISGNVTLDGAICYLAGNVTITGSVSGTGTFICIGNLTIASGAQFQVQSLVPSGFALGVGGTMEIDP